MRFALDGTFLYDAPTWGPAWTNVYNAMARSGEDELAVFTQSLRPRIRPALHPSIRVARIPVPRGFLVGLWRRGWLGIERFVGETDAVFVVSYRLPPARAPRVVFLHDLAFLTHPETFPARMRDDLAARVPEVLRTAEAVVCASHATRREACARLGLDAARARVVYQGVEHARFTPGDPSEEVLARYGLTPGYFVFVGTLEPRKNLVRLARAYRAAGGPRGLGRELVLVGGKGWLSEADLAEVDSVEGVRRLGFVSAEDLPDLYRGAHAFLYPSLAEGFGLPVLEALASGVPVLTSSVSSLPEVGGPGAVYVDPTDEAAIAAGIATLAAEDEAARRERIESGRDFVRAFTWERTARGILSALREAAGAAKG